MPAFDPTAEQEQILGHDSSRSARVLAGPGTGKSATVVALIERLLAAGGGSRIQLLTFTRAATSELAKKLVEHVTSEVERPSTIHSFAISVLLRNDGAGDFPRPLRMADEWEERWIVHASLARRVRIPVKRVRWLFGELAANWESLRPDENPQVDPAERARFQGAWQEHRTILGYTLLAELPFQLLRAMEAHGELEGLDYGLLVVDEYQDLNACDLRVLKTIGDRGCSIIGAGDDDQSIYSFRRALPEGIRRFPSDYPSADDYTLSITLRCGRRIVEWAAHVIVGDPDRPTNRAIPHSRADAPEGEVGLLSFASEKAEAKGVADIVERLHLNDGVPLPEILILLRGDHNGNFSRPIKAELTQKGLAFADPNVVKDFLADATNRRSLALYRLGVNREDSLAWATLFSLQPGVGAAFFDYIYERARLARSSFGAAVFVGHAKAFDGGPTGSSARAHRLVDEVTDWLDRHPVPDEAPGAGWGGWMCSDIESGAPPLTLGLQELLGKLDEVVERSVSLGSYLSQIAPLGKDIAQTEAAGVRIMTMMGSKGLTVEATIVAGVENGIVPRPDVDLGEERRLLYVAMTRSKQFLYCTWVKRRSGPTARSGAPSTGLRRFSPFLESGPVASQDGRAYMGARWG